MKRFLLVFLTVTALFAFCAEASERTVAQGRCGDAATWTLSEDGVLTVVGYGSMWDYGHDYFAPWYQYRANVKKLVISDGITHVGRYCFSDCSSLSYVKVPQTVKVFGENAFNGCTSLNAVDISSVESWCKTEFLTRNANPMVHGAYLYLGGELLTEIIVPDSVTEIYSYAFVNCRNAANVFIPDSVKGVSFLTFDKCSNITITGYEESAARKYASESDIPFNAIIETSTGAGDMVEVTLPPFPVKVFGKEFDSTYAAYPMLFYKDITYYPLTYTGSRNAGISADFTLERGLELYRTEEIGSYPFECSEQKNPAELCANIAKGTVRVNGDRMYNPVREYPFLIFRDITYFPLTWDLAKVRFGWNYHFDPENGLAISR